MAVDTQEKRGELGVRGLLLLNNFDVSMGQHAPFQSADLVPLAVPIASASSTLTVYPSNTKTIPELSNDLRDIKSYLAPLIVCDPLHREVRLVSRACFRQQPHGARLLLQHVSENHQGRPTRPNGSLAETFFIGKNEIRADEKTRQQMCSGRYWTLSLCPLALQPTPTKQRSRTSKGARASNGSRA